MKRKSVRSSIGDRGKCTVVQTSVVPATVLLFFAPASRTGECDLFANLSVCV